MPFNGAGVFTRIYSWITDAANGLYVDATRTDTDSDDIADGLTNCITRDGQSPATANIPLGGFKITGLATGTLGTDAVNFTQTFVAPSYTGGVTFSGGLIGTGNVTFTGGTVDMDGATAVLVPTVALGDNSTNAASTAFVTQAAFQTVLPAQSLGFLRSSGAAAAFTTTHTGYAQNEVKGADIASAATINLTTATGNLTHVTGTTPITAITIPVGAERTVIFDGALTLTHGAGLLLPGAANITTAANDRAIIRGDTAGAIVTSYTKADGTAVKGGLTLVATLTPTAAANLDFLTTFTAAYDNYLVLPEGLLPNAADNLVARAAVAGAAVATSIYFEINTFNGNTTTGQSSITVSASPGQITTGVGVSGKIEFFNVNDAVNLKAVIPCVLGQTNATPTFVMTQRANVVNTASVLTGFRLFWSGGALFQATGKVRVYGYNNS